MKDVFWLIPNRLAGRSGPNYAPWSLAELRSAGFHAVLNLSEFEPCHADFAAAQLDVAWVPLPNTCPADDAAEDACLRDLPKAYEILQSHLAAQRAVLVHCSWGRDRTGLLLAHHLVCSAGISPSDAIARVRTVRPVALTAPGWEEMGQRIIAKLVRHRSDPA